MSNELYSFVKAVSLIALSITAFSFGVLVFALVDKFFPDPLQYGFFSPRGLTTALASLIIAFPLYGVLMWQLGKATGKNPELRRSKIAKWITYIVLVAVAGIIIGDFIAVLSSLLSGELTIRFFLKALTILLIAGSVFGYYLWSLQGRSEKTPAAVKIFAGVVVAAVVLAVGYGLTLVGTPAQQRLLQFDERRVSDLQNITYAVDSYWQRNEQLPEMLEDLREPRYYVQSLGDPRTGEPYEYRVVNEDSYELCAAFEAEYQGDPYARIPASESFWNHGAGRTCFTLEVRKPLQGEPSIPIPAPPR